MPRSACILQLFVSFHAIQVLTSVSRIKIQPDSQLITKYVGDSVNLTCFIDIENRKDSHQPPLRDISNALTYTLNWILPSNGEERVEYTEQRDRVTVYVKDLEEADHGNYTCNLLSENKVLSQTSSIYLAILPRGRLSSCNPKSFYCEKTLCIPNRYECDGISDCPNGLDESRQHCGSDPCSGKLPCDDGRCLSPSECCREPSRSPPNCTLHPTIRCCRQLIHPALLDQDLYYLASRPNVKQEMWYFQTSLLVGGFVLLMTFITVGLVISLRYRLCRPYSTPPTNWRRTTPPLSPWMGCNRTHHPTDQYLLQSSSGSVLLDRPEYIRQIPGLRSDLLSPNVLRSQSAEDTALVLVPLSQTRLPLVPIDFGGPPPSYQQVIGGPPPPYTSENESLRGQVLEVPLLGSSETPVLFNNNNNGDINGNITSRHHPLAQNRNLTGTTRTINTTSLIPTSHTITAVTSSSSSASSSSSSSYPSSRSLSSSSSSSSSPSLFFSGSSHSGAQYNFLHAQK